MRDSATATHQPLSPVAIQERSRHRLGSPRGVNVAFGHRDDRALHEDGPGVGEGNGVMNAGFLGSSTPIKTIVDAAAGLKPAAVVLSVVTRQPFEAVADGIRHPSRDTPLLIGGEAR